MISAHVLARRYLRTVLSLSIAAGLALVGAACASGELESAYRVVVLDQPVPVGAHSAITVRMVNAATGDPVTGATFSRATLAMTMTAPPPPGKAGWPSSRSHAEEIRFVGPADAGQYRFVGDVSMPGAWTLVVLASVPGEALPVERSTRFTASRERHDP